MAEGHGGDPAQAFEDLRAEVSVLRRAIEAVPAAVRENRPPDLSADLGVLGKGLDELGEQLEAIMKSPALSRTPEQQGQAIATAGANLVREAAQRLDRAAQEAERERSRLSGIIGQAHAQDRQFKLLCWVGGAACVVGLLLSPIIAGLLPFGLNTRVAALVMRGDRWTAGGELMRAANPSGWNGFVADTQLVRENREAVDGCRAAAARTGKTQHCALMVALPIPALIGTTARPIAGPRIPTGWSRGGSRSGAVGSSQRRVAGVEPMRKIDPCKTVEVSACLQIAGAQASGQVLCGNRAYRPCAPRCRIERPARTSPGRARPRKAR